ncbi:MAG: 3-mercaptopyruvate sulfurtransferase [Rhodospirillaceae bacterium]|jgi:thiosulfate/3-mercaptopyruvate sulfurtransferase|nr:3-mercaptopyruvate sulfurtransferase [Rhodospirillaceae bacterium]MBT6138219.1 3-mercaptopyruvate sulfurtransferase [Rhodospirillaceae bacterium]
MSYANPDALVSTEWLNDHLEDDGVVLVDGSFHLPTANRDANAEFLEKHIPGARRFDIDDICDPTSDLPHMIPTAEMFAEKVGALGISNASKVVVYDVYGMQSAARTWWMFRLFGHDNVAILNGGMPKWLADGHSLVGGAAQASPATFKATLNPALVRSIDDVRRVLDDASEQVVDVRSAGRFTAAEPEPRAGMRSGHMPGALNLPFNELLEKADKTLLPAEAIQARIDSAGIDLDKPVTASCGSGVTACVLALGAYLIGKDDVAVYDGSWSEWGGRPDTPIVTD